MEKSAGDSRRDFLRTSAVSLTGLLAPPLIVPASSLGRGATPPSDRVTVGIIGSGQRAVFETLQYPSFDNVVIVALADVVPDHLQSAKEKLEKQYAGRAAVVFLDVWKDQAPARRFGIRTIPTQIFFDKDGKEVYRHEGFLSEEEIVRQLKDMGVKLKG